MIDWTNARAFPAGFEREQILQALPGPIALRVADSNVTERERDAVRRLLR